MTTDYQTEKWFIALQNACQTASQKQVADQCGISSTAVNQVLKGVYKGNLENVKEKISGALLKHSVICPVLDEITVDVCARYRKQGYLPTNPLRVQLYRACQTCPNNPKNQGESL
ncbi:helix-turn-helix transcriptional regulator [Thiomicrorhabdus indica]|uniref:helix-turn-helix domain-containing protein n=1 Tax=Thiomicrorhabdus indica TaxID=2267253 RepID=UPI002AA77920|nr:helix-turn-helix transcriptional regulator [Thiomicrorhabdus indica]